MLSQSLAESIFYQMGSLCKYEKNLWKFISIQVWQYLKKYLL